MDEALPQQPESFDVPGYRVERVLARGGFGTVLAAVDDAGHRVALKVSARGDATSAAQLAREEIALRAVGPKVAPALLGSGKLADGTPYLALELLESPTLSQRLREGGPIGPDEFNSIARLLCDAVGATHASGFLHLDLKPQNIFLTPQGIRLIDFGLARGMSERAATVASFAGTAEYASPEQCEEQRDLDPRADVYAIGVLLFEMLTGRIPFTGDAREIRQAHVARRPPRLSQFASVPPALETVVLRTLAKERAQRYATCADLKAALEIAASDSKASGKNVTNPVAESRLQRKSVGLLFFVTDADTGSVREAIRSLGGELAWVGRRRYATVFAGAAGHDPVRRAVRAADDLTARKLIVRAIVDVGAVGTQTRADGSVRYLAPELSREDRYPADADPLGTLTTAQAAQVLQDIQWEPVPGRSLYAPRTKRGAVLRTATVVQLGAGPLVGRDDILRDLVRAAEFAVQGNPSIAVVIGEPGLGKTHLAATLLDDLRSRIPMAELLEVRAREPIPGDSDESLRMLLSRAIDLGVTDTEASARSRFLEAVGQEKCNELWPAAALTLRLVPTDTTRVRSLAAAPGVLRAMAMRAAGEALRSRAGRHPVCIFIDDAQFADDVALDALEFAALDEAKAPLFICVLARPSFLESRKSFGERAARTRAYRLAGLNPTAAAELCRRLLAPAENVPKRAIDLLLERTQGIPLLLVELVRGLKRDGLVRKRLRGDSWFLATDELELLPDLPLIDWLAEREVGTLPPELGAHARLSALLGLEFLVDELHGIITELDRAGFADDYPFDARVASSRLVGLGLLVTTRTGAFRFRHALVRDAIAKSVPRGDAQRIHRAAAQFYRDAKSLEPARRIPLLARHAAEAGLNAEAASLYLQLAEEARGRHSYFDAEQSYTNALNLLAPEKTPERLAAHRGRGSMRYRIGRYEDAFRDFEESRALARSVADRNAECEIVLDAATALDWVTDYDRSRALVQEAEDLGRDLGTAPIRARLILGKGRALYRAHQWQEARAALEDAARLAENVGDEAYETLIISLVILEMVLGELRRIDDAERVSARAISLARERGDQLHFIGALINRRLVQIARRDVNGAIQDLQTVKRIGRELGMILLEYVAEANLSELFYQIDDLGRAEDHARRAIAIEERHPEVAGRGPVGVLRLARIAAYRGDAVQARELLRRVQGMRDSAAANVSGTLTAADEVLAATVDLATRDATTSEWEALLRRSERDSVEQDPIEVAELYGVWALRKGSAEEARRAFEEAARRAARIPNIMGARVEKGLAATGGPLKIVLP